jgi:hypothetical protein
MAHGVILILKHLEVDKITKKNNRGAAPFNRGADGLFGRKEGRGTLFLTD